MSFVTTITCLLWLATSVQGGEHTNVYLDQNGNTQHARPNMTNPFRIFSPEEMERERQERKQRMRERRERARELLKNAPPPKAETLERMQGEDLEKLKERKLGWFGGSVDTSAFSSGVLADPSQDYDKWAQAYRMLGGFIDCDHSKDGGSHDNNNGNNGGACSRWMMWAAVRASLDCFYTLSLRTAKAHIHSLALSFTVRQPELPGR